MTILKQMILFFSTLLILSNPVSTWASSGGSPICRELFRQFPTSRALPKAAVAETLAKAIELSPNRVGPPVDYILIDGVKVPRYSKTSKWRAVLVLEENDAIDSHGYLSGYARNGENESLVSKAKFNRTNDDVTYRFADGREEQVSAQTARALEFSYLDAVNPKSPQNSIVVGIHDDLAHIVRITRQVQAGILGHPRAYIRIDEISTYDLPLTSAEALYKKYDLYNPNYNPQGEWISDGSIPLQNIEATYKFKAVHGIVPLRGYRRSVYYDNFTLQMNEEIVYTAINKTKYYGRIARDYVVDGYVIVSYQDRFGRMRYDLAHTAQISKLGRLDQPDLPFQINVREINQSFKVGPANLFAVMEKLSADPDLKNLYDASSGTAEGYSIRTHSNMVFEVFREFAKSYPNLQNLKMSSGMSAYEFLAKVIVVHDIGKPRSFANGGIQHQHEHTVPIAKRILTQLGFSHSELQLAEALISHDNFGQVFNARSSEKMTPQELVQTLQARAGVLGIPLRILYDFQLSFFTADAASYPNVRKGYFTIDSSGRLVPKSELLNELETLIQQAQ